MPYSARNRVVEFSVDGETKNGDYIKATNEGGVAFVKGIHFRLIPWNVVYDPRTRAWVVFLANVTSKNFRIVYAYLHNGTGAFTIWYYDYENSSFDGYIFYGADHIANKTAMTPSVQMPKLSIVPEAKQPSGISALGPTLFVTDQRGLYINRTETLFLYPILYRGFTGTSELWLLADDRQGGYYYSIFYLFENDRDHVFRGHTVRLNDLYQIAFENIAAQWTPGLFPFLLNVNSDLSNVTVKINGFPFKADGFGRIEIRVPAGDIHIEAQKEIAVGRGVRKVFDEWKWLTRSNPTTLRMTSNANLYLSYRTQFYLSVSSQHGAPVGEGWYEAGTAANITVNPIIDFMNGTRLVFSGWTGDEKIDSSAGRIIIDRPKTLRANWRWQYEIQISTRGLPPDTSVSVTVNENRTSLTAPFKHRQWIDSNSALIISIFPTNLTSSETRFVFRQWQMETGGTVTFPISVTSPMQLIARYETAEPFAGKITIYAVPSTLLPGDIVTLKGSISPARSDTNVTIFWSPESAEWLSIGTVTADSKGSYEFTWKPWDIEKIYFKARWTYDLDYEPIESPVAVVTRIIPPKGASSKWPEFLQSFVKFLDTLHVPSRLTAMLLYPLISVNALVGTHFTAMGGPQWLQEVLVWILTGALVGPLYIGPFLVIFAVAWRKFTRRKPSARPLLPMAVLTFIGMGLTLLGQFLSTPLIAQLGFAIATIAPSFLTAFLAAFVAAKIS